MFKKIYSRIVLWFATLTLKVFSPLFKLAIKKQELPQATEIDDHRLGLSLLYRELELNKDEFGMACDNDNVPKKLELLQQIQNDQYQRTRVIEKSGVIGAIKKASNPYEDLEYATNDTDPKTIELLKKEIRYLDLLKEIDKHRFAYNFNNQSYESWMEEHRALIKERDEIWAEKTEVGKDAISNVKYAIDQIEEELDLKSK